MPTWILLAIAAQFLTAISVFVDRYVLVHAKGIGRPVVYAFYVSLLSGFVLVLLPFGVISVPSTTILGLSFVGALTFIASILLLYSALRQSPASDVMPVIAAFSAITSFLLAHLWLESGLPTQFVAACVLFIIGTLLISRFRFTKRSLALVICSGVLFGTTAFIFKLIFLHTTFLDGFFWSRMANVLGALLLLLWPANARAIFHGSRESSHQTKWIVVGNKTLAGVASALILFAISLGSVSVVNAMSGLQFAFLPVIAFVFADRFPIVLRAEIHTHGLRHKLFGIALIVFGLGALYLA